LEAAPSRTAMLAAVARGLHRQDEDRPWVLDDPFALILVGPVWQAIAEHLAALFPERIARKANAGIAMRSRFAEDRLTQGGFAQYAILGAGLDSCVWRRPDLLRSLRIFEVDHPLSQAWKRERITEVGLPTYGDRLVFAPVDFEVESLRRGLDAAGFEWEQRTLFSWLAVTPYLRVEAIEETLRTLASSASGSEVAFSYALAPELQDDDDREFVSILMPLAASSGEPLRSFFAPGEIDTLVRGCGLEVVDHPDRAELIRRYFADRTDGLQPYGGECFVTARVP
jgi:methyltransferase (TIGR00027 family)